MLYNLDERSRYILSAIVESYINKLEPVGSRFLTKRYPFGISSATIRNVMADLEDLGFLVQPHTSAGRIPTDRGYRYYVDNLLVRRDASSDLTREFIQQISNRLIEIRNDVNELFFTITNTLSVMSNYIGVALAPKAAQTTFNRIDLIKYRDDMIVAILLTEEGIIRNRILRGGSGVNQKNLNEISDYLNSQFSGFTIDEIRGALIKRMQSEKSLCENLVSRALLICDQALSFTGDDLFVSGLYDAMNLPDFSDITKIKELAKAIREKHTILKLLNELSEEEGLHIVIGAENPVEELKNLSIVASTYKEKNRPIGVIALIGPKRMNYGRAISIVDMAAKLVSTRLEER